MTLGEIAEFFSGGTPSRKKPEFYAGDVPWVTGADISRDMSVVTRFQITDEAVRQSATTVLEPDTALLVTRTSVGKVGLIARPTAISQDITGIRPGKSLDLRYMVHFLRRHEPDLVRSARGATIKGVTREAVTGLHIPLPPLIEQQRIAEILDKADALRAKRRKALGRMECLERAIFHEMFGGLEATSTVADIALPQKGSIRTGPFGSQLRHGEFVEDGVAVIGLDNVVGNEFTWGERRFITAEKFQQLKRYEVRPGDVLISIMGTTGRCVVAPDGIPTAITTKHLCAITPDPNQMHPAVLRASFLWHAESRQHLRRQTKGSIMDGLNMGIIKTMPVPVPPIDLQRDYVERAERFAQLRDAAGAQRHVQEALFNSLQSRAFRGEL